ncbi:hypothetical protein K437DRAFT_253238 [Tilletiaria anomala UBC 951]|uniref:Autophagy-related protein 27 n=1 Tax=Tilletiaria anomala (strain ATCC 24038 / CBS 436.72 / UBC 951) TaxID=1037660 RepID=A0A066WKX0_TILAU|nr:uncharacterized protein K437DRAFT_253238 [Tilletiaria anomala UBC 951]KDN53223.1 hypothetical protein K437DRAFT_253238 [Tilletiaria anomala UBC 951]
MAIKTSLRCWGRSRIPLIRRVILVLAAASLAAGATDHNHFTCKDIKVNNKHYDLSHISFPISISSTKATPPTKTEERLALDLCKPLNYHERSPANDQCPKGSWACLLVVNSKQGESDRITQVIPLITPEKEGGEQTAIRWDTDEGNTVEEGEQWQLRLHGATYADKKQKTLINFKCDHKAPKSANPVWEHYDARDGELKLDWSTPYACASNDNGNGDDGNDAGRGNGDASQPRTDGGWGFFSWFFFLLFLTFGTYFALGTYRNYQQFGIIEIPHKEFWRESPFLLQDVAKQALRGLSGGFRGSSRGDYEAL